MSQLGQEHNSESHKRFLALLDKHRTVRGFQRRKLAVQFHHAHEVVAKESEEQFNSSLLQVI